MILNWKPSPGFAPTAYVSVAGNDLNDGSSQNPYKTLQKAKDAGKTHVYIGPGVYREVPNFGYIDIYCDSVVIDLNTLNGYYYNASYGSLVPNIKIINGQNLGFGNYINSVFKNITNGANINYLGSSKNLYKYVAYNSNTPISFALGSVGLKNCTFDFCYVRFISSNSGLLTGMTYSIFSNSKIEIQSVFTDTLSNDYNLFYNCSFKFGADVTYLTQAQIEATYGLSGIEAIRAYYNAKFGTTNIFMRSKVANPLFNNANIDDYTLQPLSPARHMAYDGTFIGAFDVAFPIKPYTNDLSFPDGFYNASKGANIISSSTKLSLARNVDGSSVGGGQITTKPQDLISVYELRTILASQQVADRNREWIDTNADIDMTAPINPGTAITVGEYYVVEGGSAIYNSVTYQTRAKFLAVAGQTAFTSPDGGYLYQIKEAPNRATCEMRFKQTINGTVINAGTNLTANNWYRVVNNQVTWNALSIPVGDSFQALAGLLSFTGGGCIEIFSDADIWYEFEIGDKPMCKKVGNVITGAIDVGTDGKPLTNGHKEFYSITNIARASQIIQARYIQYRLTFQNKMLK